ncbi:MAG: hypothetical protein Q8Q12_21645 [bacterium]|nr:hypothetical protein [bacterium]
MKMTRQLKEALGRIVALCTVAQESEGGADALADTLDELGETMQGVRMLRKMMEGRDGLR